MRVMQVLSLEFGQWYQWGKLILWLGRNLSSKEAVVVECETAWDAEQVFECMASMEEVGFTVEEVTNA